MKLSSYHKHRLLLIELSNWHLRDFFIANFFFLYYKFLVFWCRLNFFLFSIKITKCSFFSISNMYRRRRRRRKVVKCVSSIGHRILFWLLLFVEQLILSWGRQFWDNASQCSIFRTQTLIFLLVLLQLLQFFIRFIFLHCNYGKEMEKRKKEKRENKFPCLCIYKKYFYWWW